MSTHGHARPISKKLLTPGFYAMAVLSIIGITIALYRFAFGMGTVTNLDNNYPWGLWIGVDVASGVALAAGGFTTAFLAHILHRHKYETIVRPALLTAMLGYTFVGLGVFTDLGKYYNIWHLMLPSMWQFNSALFEVGMCVMMYLTVLYIEFLPLVTERFIGRVDLPGILATINKPVDACLRIAQRTLDKLIFVFVILGVVLSCAHQSSLGTLLTIAPYKVHPLWWSPFLPLMFLLSAIAVGYPMVIFESMWAHKSFGLKNDMQTLSALARIIPFTIGLYLAVKIGDLIYRGAYIHIFDNSKQSNMFLVEIVFGVITPFLMFAFARVRKDARLLFTAAALYVLCGVLLNRVNVFVVSYQPQFTGYSYVPHPLEVLLTIGYIALLMLLYRVIVTIFPVITHHE
ncbi:MAG: Ni/Fe-hydrogenase cytochrome b subunit [Deltaproteobacteria bacterium]|nr:Ni/Fe-hydrogenase cytochrome b subunit [Deltaproteobacteria bacterium]